MLLLSSLQTSHWKNLSLLSLMWIKLLKNKFTSKIVDWPANTMGVIKSIIQCRGRIVPSSLIWMRFWCVWRVWEEEGGVSHVSILVNIYLPGTLVTLVVSHWTIGSLPSINWSLSPLTGLKPIKINVNYPLGQENPRQSPHQSTAGYFDKSILMWAFIKQI